MVQSALTFIAKPDKDGKWYVYIQGTSIVVAGPMDKRDAEELKARLTANENFREYCDRMQEQWEKECHRKKLAQEEQEKLQKQLLMDNEKLQQLLQEIIDQLLNPDQDEDDNPDKDSGPRM